MPRSAVLLPLHLQINNELGQQTQPQSPLTSPALLATSVVCSKQWEVVRSVTNRQREGEREIKRETATSLPAALFVILNLRAD